MMTFPDLDSAIAGSASAIFFNQGQCCCAGSRLYVEDKVFDKVVEGVAERAEKLQVGPGMEACQLFLRILLCHIDQVFFVARLRHRRDNRRCTRPSGTTRPLMPSLRRRALSPAARQACHRAQRA